LDRVPGGAEDDWNRAGQSFGGEYGALASNGKTARLAHQIWVWRSRAARGDDGHPPANQIGRQACAFSMLSKTLMTIRLRGGSPSTSMTFAFGVIPISVRTLHVEKIDQKNYEIQSREHDPLIARWDHLVSIKPLDDTRSIYCDTIDIGAGSLPFVVGAWANWFYCHHQRRWRAPATTL
jgi:hypothetical protein